MQWEEMLGHGCRTLLPHSSLATSCFCQEGLKAPGCAHTACGSASCSQATKVKGKPIFPSLPKGLPYASHQQQTRAGNSFKKSPGLSTGAQQDQPYSPLHLPGWGPGLSG